MRPPLATLSQPVTRASIPAALEWTLRVGACLCFVGHGAFGLITKEGWVPYFAVVGIGRDVAYQLMPFIGTLDILLGLLTLVRPRPALLLWMTLWAVWIASLRPLSGEPVWEMLERAGNYGVPLALLLMYERSSRWLLWFAPTAIRTFSPALVHQLRLTMTATTSLLLLGHGALAVLGKKELVVHYALLGLPMSAVSISMAVGCIEIGLAALVLWQQSVAFGLFIFGWKLATEWLFLMAGAPLWEVVERGGSYAAPLALALLLLFTRTSPEVGDGAKSRTHGRRSGAGLEGHGNAADLLSAAGWRHNARGDERVEEGARCGTRDRVRLS